MNKMFFLFLLVFLFNEVQSQVNLALKHEDIFKLLELTQVVESAELLVNEGVRLFQAKYPQVPTAEWNKIKSKIDYAKYLERLVPIYDKTFTHDEIKQLILFLALQLVKNT